MAFYKGLSEKNKDKRSSFNGILQGIEYYVVLLRFLLYFEIKTSEARSMAFYKGLSEKSKVHGDDFKNR
ncbi:hypothetical protein T4C_11987 [Trichinella pseudospiralis]|uniref:Uncharacterized protein n=1 Tax=Trichinella pseudospiralis TaxID=6337 RepID=A0A0V1GKD8_TRIPS|nr:hypothetical protein T4C_11987 [Trichinella pseudospiralis]